MSTLVTIIHVICCLFLMLTVLLQSGKGGGMGAAFGGGNAATVFGGSGASTFLKKLTAGAATVFMLTSMTLAYISSSDAGDALEEFGNEQQELAKQKDEARKKALDEAAKGSAAGSGSASGSAGSAAGSAAGSSSDSMPTAGSGLNPVMDDGDIEDGDHGAAEVPAEIGSGAATGSAAKPPAIPATVGEPKQPANTP